MAPPPKWASVEVGSLVMNSRYFFGDENYCPVFVGIFWCHEATSIYWNVSQGFWTLLKRCWLLWLELWVFWVSPQKKKPAPKQGPSGSVKTSHLMYFKKIVRFSDVISRSQLGKRPVGHDSNYGMILLMQEMLLTTWDVFQPGAATGMKGNSCTDSAQVIAWWSENTWFQGIGIRGEFLVRIYS